MGFRLGLSSKMAISWGKYEKMMKIQQKGGTLNFSIFFPQTPDLSTMEKWVKRLATPNISSVVSVQCFFPQS